MMYRELVKVANTYCNGYVKPYNGVRFHHLSFAQGSRGVCIPLHLFINLVSLKDLHDDNEMDRDVVVSASEVQECYWGSGLYRIADLARLNCQTSMISLLCFHIRYCSSF